MQNKAYLVIKDSNVYRLTKIPWTKDPWDIINTLEGWKDALEDWCKDIPAVRDYITLDINNPTIALWLLQGKIDTNVIVQDWQKIDSSLAEKFWSLENAK